MTAIQVNSVTVPDRKHTQYSALLFASTVLQRLATHQRKAENNNEVEMGEQNSTEIFIFYVDTYLDLFLISPHLQTYTHIQQTTRPKVCALTCLACKLHQMVKTGEQQNILSSSV